MTGTVIGLLALHVSQPPAASNTLVIALGALRPTLHDIVAMIVGVLILATCGEFLRRLRLSTPQAIDDSTMKSNPTSS